MRTPAFVLALSLGILTLGGTTTSTVVTATHTTETPELLASNVAANPVAAVVSPEALTVDVPVTAEVRSGPAGLDPAALDAARRASVKGAARPAVLRDRGSAPSSSSR